MSELKPCPFCGAMPEKLRTGYMCSTLGCALQENTVSEKEWNNRPIEDALTARIAELEYQLEDWTNNGWAEDYKARIAELEAENERLSQLLHDEMSQLEIATDLGNKRWIALNEIYEKSEKHSAWWCKRKAQEGLGIK